MYHLKQVPSEAQIKKYLRRIVFGKNLFCPHCRSRDVLTYEERYRCQKCRTKFSLLSHTWLADLKLSYQHLWLILWCWTTSVPVRQAASLTECSDEAVYRWYERFRTHLPENSVILEKIIQLDEAYFKRWALFLGKQTGSRKLAYEFVPGRSVERHQATFFLQQHVKPRSRLWTDGASIYKTIDQWWPVHHETDIHRRFEFGKTSEIEGMFGNLRTFIRRMYHHATPDKLPGIVREFCIRFSSPEIFENPLRYLEKSLTLVPID